MILFNLFTDPHLGTRRAAHTTRSSSDALRQRLFDVARNLSKLPSSICLGDLFDRAFNDEATILQGWTVAEQCLATLSGNHDETNRVGTYTSLNLIEQAGLSVVSNPDLSAPFFDVLDNTLFFVPHHASQKLFEQALDDAAEHAQTYAKSRATVLLLHCNMDAPFCEEDDTLNLTMEKAESLLNHFDYIFLGHEHKPKTLLDGRVVLLGNTHPTSFSDISDKYRYELTIDGSTAFYEKKKIWDSSKKFRKLSLGDDLSDMNGVEFVDIVGEQGDYETHEVAAFVQAVWESSDSLFAVRNSVQMSSHLGAVEEEVAVDTSDIRERIDNDLAGSPMQSLYRELRQEVEA